MFFNDLLTQAYRYQSQGPFFIMGDFNSRCGNSLDYIEGVDDLMERNVIDKQCNKYGEFLLSASCCIINGQRCLNNHFTSFKHAGQAVIDYGVVSYEFMNCYDNFQVLKPLKLYNNARCIGVSEGRSVIPDHAMLT